MSGRFGPRRLGALDRVFLAGEHRESMMHVGALLLFAPPAEGDPSFGRELVRELSRDARVQPPWSLKLRYPDLLANPLQAWVEDDRFDLDYHVRRSALPSPGDERELGILVSRLHSVPLDFHRPPWEAHFIEGLEGGRLAIYFKVHHALVDGFTGVRLLAHGLSRDPDDRDTPLFYARPPPERPARARADAPALEVLLRAAREQLGTTKDVGRALLAAARKRHGDGPVLPLEAPRSVLNRRITRSRRFATQQVALDALKDVAHRHDGTVNDVVLAVCGGALRRFLLEQGALPEEPLVAMLPVNVRPKDDAGGGNAVGAILASLATDVASPTDRLDAIVRSTTRAKEHLRGLSREAIAQYGALMMTPLVLSFFPGAVTKVRPAFNVIVSNVPGPAEALWLRGRRLQAVYPVSIPFHGYALNVTVESYAGMLDFGFIGCRDTVPHLQRLAVYAGEAAGELASA